MYGQFGMGVTVKRNGAWSGGVGEGWCAEMVWTCAENGEERFHEECMREGLRTWMSGEDHL